MASASISVHIDRDAVIRMNQPTGMIHRWTVGIADEVVAVAIAEAPVRSGRMKAGIRRGTGSWSRSGVSVRVFSDAKYTTYVHGGTFGPIFAHTGRAMRLGSLNPRLPVATRAQPMRGIRANRRAVKSVSGQRSNPFMSRALRQVLAAHGH